MKKSIAANLGLECGSRREGNARSSAAQIRRSIQLPSYANAS